jgi:hypothetical protein
MITPPSGELVWLAFAATVACVGSVWQCVIAAISGVESMESFLGDHNRLVHEEQQRAVASIPRWRLRLRRREAKRIVAESRVVLTDDERRLSRAYDRQAGAWSCVIVGTFIAAVLAWIQVFGG